MAIRHKARKSASYIENGDGPSPNVRDGTLWHGSAYRKWSTTNFPCQLAHWVYSGCPSSFSAISSRDAPVPRLGKRKYPALLLADRVGDYRIRQVEKEERRQPQMIEGLTRPDERR